MTVEERRAVKKLLGASNTWYVVKLNHRKNILKDVYPEGITRDARGLLRAQYEDTAPKYSDTLQGIGLVRVLMTNAPGPAPLVCWKDGAGDTIVLAHTANIDAMVDYYARDLERLGLGKVPLEGVFDDPRGQTRTRYTTRVFGSGKQISAIEVDAAHTVVKHLCEVAEKGHMDTIAYKTLAELIPERLLKKKGAA